MRVLASRNFGRAPMLKVKCFDVRNFGSRGVMFVAARLNVALNSILDAIDTALKQIEKVKASLFRRDADYAGGLGCTYFQC